MRDSPVRSIAILGSTGSIGTQTLEVIASQPDSFRVELLTARSNTGLLIQQARTFVPNMVVIGDESRLDEVRSALTDLPIKVFAGPEAIIQAVAMESIDVVVTAMVGYSGLGPTLAAIEAGKTIGLANKETLVVAGELVTRKARERGVNIFPIDSEHSAIFQCMAGEWHNPIEKIYLTASGGPFRGKKTADLEQVTAREALKHPNWNMGAKITVDSATLMNKGLEMIEARWLFQLEPERIDVVVHPQSVIHSIVQFEDGSMKAQMGLPDMKLPIQYAIGFPNRLKSSFPRFDFARYPSLTFEAPDTETFPCLSLAARAMSAAGNIPCAMNAANEVAVAAFLEGSLSFCGIPELIGHVMDKTVFQLSPGLEDYMETDRQSRALAIAWLSR